MAKYRIYGAGFPVGQHLVPSGTLIDTDATDQWSQLCRGLDPPVDAQALDQSTYDEMVRLYGAYRVAPLRS